MSFWCLQFSQKNKQKQFDVRYHSSKVEFFRLFFGRIKIPKRHFEINWPLVVTNRFIVAWDWQFSTAFNQIEPRQVVFSLPPYSEGTFVVCTCFVCNYVVMDFTKPWGIFVWVLAAIISRISVYQSSGKYHAVIRRSSDSHQVVLMQLSSSH